MTCCAEKHFPVGEVTSKSRLPHWNVTKTLASTLVWFDLVVMWNFFFLWWWGEDKVKIGESKRGAEWASSGDVSALGV